ncbi:zinc finger CCCH domain-containing protein 27 [Cryptomeria japonica]|uniref:zinc finger CCCH domain-containing protein 27 n=1 Tax=Cryptomeria japonica TaxID=3369 RepID=UPI0027DA9B45|nr:zinc finger CCCH domain-containing protein 27 [Cryptomeria japonica]XP_057872657.2 zinc finger CCCH domain-containing protein 27 [Cryptomeria japonica]XP_057872675.2 zinc finger CCCH domain-containing protein 27 [Cryptomeria japonica]
MKLKMKIEESLIRGYLLRNLQPLTEADPALLANYIVALLKNNKPKKELQKLCVDKLYDFLGDETKSFVIKLFHAIEDGSIVTSNEQAEGTQTNETPTAVVSGGPTELGNSSPQPERLPVAAVGAFNELEEKGISDDDDDDRNHKHRRVTRSQSFDQDGQGDEERRSNKKWGRYSENGQSLQESESQFSNRCREYTASHLDKESSVKHDRKRYGSSLSPHLNADGGQRVARVSHIFHNESESRFDGQNTFPHAGSGRGRGRSTFAWAPHDSRFTSVETVDFASAVLPQGTTSTSLFPGTGRAITNSVKATNSAWNAFGMIPGLSSCSLEQLHPMHSGMQGGRGPSLNATFGLGMGMGHPRCRDFEERGFCLRGDMCPMEHGLNRIVVEDVQSLSQFNLPVSLPTGHLLGMKSGAVGGISSAVVSTLAPSSKSSYIKKYRANDDTAHLNGMSTASVENEPDFYDPDQPLWNKDRPDSSCALIQLLSLGKVEEHLWDDNSSDRHSCRLSDGDNERSGQSMSAAVVSHNVVVPSVWGRMGPIDPTCNHLGDNKRGDTSSKAVQSGKKSRKKVYGEKHCYRCGSICSGKCGIEMKGYEDTGAKAVKVPLQQGKVNDSVIPGLNGESGSRLSSGFLASGNGSRGSRGKGTEKAVRTLFVNCIPPQSNRRELLLSHFQKFGEVLDIHIPKNSEKSFVQFRHRDSAEAALASPDAVMGNRFIRLSWANRDSILTGGESSVTIVPPGRIATGGISNSQPQKMEAEKGKEKVNDVCPVVPGISTLEVSSTETSALRSVGTDEFSIPSISNVQKKQEKLELLEALRCKQEILAQKRESFRRQLDKLEKQGSFCKHDVLDTDQDGQHKSDTTAECAHLNKSFISSLQSSAGSDSGPGVENLIKGNCGDVPNQMAGSSLLSPAVFSHTSPKVFKPPFPRFPRLAASPMFSPNRFKLDNRPTAFKILPPLPACLMDIAVLKERFSVFGDLSSVEFDDVEGYADEVTKAEKCSVRVAYTTRRAAERAFGHGKSLQGQNLHFVWLMPSNSTLSHSNVENDACQISKGFNNGATAAEKEAHVGAPEFDDEFSSEAVQGGKETSYAEEVNANGARNSDKTVEVLMERCGFQDQNLNDEDNQSNPAQCSIPQSKENTGASKLNGGNSNANNFAQVDIPTEVL